MTARAGAPPRILVAAPPRILVAAPPRILVVVVNYRTGALAVDCLASLADEFATNPTMRAVVVDNASGDGSSETIAAAIAASGWSWASLVASPVNGGFAHGNNVALRAALAGSDPPELFWLLNPDTRVRPGAVAALTQFFKAKPEVGIAGTMIEEANGAPWPFAFRFPSILSEFERGIRLSLATRLLDRYRVLRRMGDEPAVVDWVSGASMVVRREVFEDIGLMDEAYFLYFEETDFCLAARRAGWSCWYVPNARIMHIAGQSTGVTATDSGRRRLPRYWFDSRRRYFTKNRGLAYAAATDLAWLGAHLLWTGRRMLTFRADDDPDHLLRDFVAGSAVWGAAGRSGSDRSASDSPRLQALSTAD